MTKYKSTKIIELGSCAFRQWRAVESHCRFIHGYQLKAKFWFEADSLDDKNWVVDFGGLKELKKILQNQFDHTLCVDKKDPLLLSFELLDKSGACNMRVMDGVGIEKTAEWCFNAAKTFLFKKYGPTHRVTKVEVWEHSENSATYEEEYSYITVNQL